jgi:hypothetical protein
LIVSSLSKIASCRAFHSLFASTSSSIDTAGFGFFFRVARDFVTCDASVSEIAADQSAIISSSQWLQLRSQSKELCNDGSFISIGC